MIHYWLSMICSSKNVWTCRNIPGLKRPLYQQYNGRALYHLQFLRVYSIIIKWSIEILNEEISYIATKLQHILDLNFLFTFLILHGSDDYIQQYFVSRQSCRHSVINTVHTTPQHSKCRWHCRQQILSDSECHRSA